MKPVVFLCAYSILCLLEFTTCKKKVPACSEDMWKLIQNSSLPTGHARLRFKIEKGYESGSYDAVIACRELVVHGGGSQKISVTKWRASYAEFGIAVPRAGVERERKEKMNNTCLFELRQTATESSQHKIFLECEVKVASSLSRIVPHCSEVNKKGEEILKYTKVMKDQGVVHIFFRSSPNNVVRIKHYCNNNPLRNMIGGSDIERDGVLISLNTFGGHERIYAINFYPDCNNFNSSIRKLFMTQDNHDCFVSIHAMCQEGMTEIKSFNVDLNRESMICHPPKSSYTLAIENAKLKLRIESDPIVFLLILLLFNFILYLLLLPCLVTLCAREFTKISKRFEERRRRGVIKHKKKFQISTSDEAGDGTSQAVKKPIDDMDFDDGDVYVACESAKYSAEYEDKIADETKSHDQHHKSRRKSSSKSSQHKKHKHSKDIVVDIEAPRLEENDEHSKDIVVDIEAPRLEENDETGEVSSEDEEPLPKLSITQDAATNTEPLTIEEDEDLIDFRDENEKHTSTSTYSYPPMPEAVKEISGEEAIVLDLQQTEVNVMPVDSKHDRPSHKKHRHTSHKSSKSDGLIGGPEEEGSSKTSRRKSKAKSHTTSHRKSGSVKEHKHREIDKDSQEKKRHSKASSTVTTRKSSKSYHSTEKTSSEEKEEEMKDNHFLKEHKHREIDKDSQAKKRHSKASSTVTTSKNSKSYHSTEKTSSKEKEEEMKDNHFELAVQPLLPKDNEDLPTPREITMIIKDRLASDSSYVVGSQLNRKEHLPDTTLIIQDNLASDSSFVERTPDGDTVTAADTQPYESSAVQRPRERSSIIPEITDIPENEDLPVPICETKEQSSTIEHEQHTNISKSLHERELTASKVLSDHPPATKSSLLVESSKHLRRASILSNELTSTDDKIADIQPPEIPSLKDVLESDELPTSQETTMRIKDWLETDMPPLVEETPDGEAAIVTDSQHYGHSTDQRPGEHAQSSTTQHEHHTVASKSSHTHTETNTKSGHTEGGSKPTKSLTSLKDTHEKQSSKPIPKTELASSSSQPHGSPNDKLSSKNIHRYPKMASKSSFELAKSQPRGSPDDKLSSKNIRRYPKTASKSSYELASSQPRGSPDDKLSSKNIRRYPKTASKSSYELASSQRGGSPDDKLSSKNIRRYPKTASKSSYELASSQRGGSPDDKLSSKVVRRYVGSKSSYKPASSEPRGSPDDKLSSKNVHKYPKTAASPSDDKLSSKNVHKYQKTAASPDDKLSSKNVHKYPKTTLKSELKSSQPHGSPDDKLSLENIRRHVSERAQPHESIDDKKIMDDHAEVEPEPLANQTIDSTPDKTIMDDNAEVQPEPLANQTIDPTPDNMPGEAFITEWSPNDLERHPSSVTQLLAQRIQLPQATTELPSVTVSVPREGRSHGKSSGKQDSLTSPEEQKHLSQYATGSPGESSHESTKSPKSKTFFSFFRRSPTGAVKKQDTTSTSHPPKDTTFSSLKKELDDAYGKKSKNHSSSIVRWRDTVIIDDVGKTENTSMSASSHTESGSKEQDSSGSTHHTPESPSTQSASSAKHKVDESKLVDLKRSSLQEHPETTFDTHTHQTMPPDAKSSSSYESPEEPQNLQTSSSHKNIHMQSGPRPSNSSSLSKSCDNLADQQEYPQPQHKRASTDRGTKKPRARPARVSSPRLYRLAPRHSSMHPEMSHSFEPQSMQFSPDLSSYSPQHKDGQHPATPLHVHWNIPSDVHRLSPRFLSQYDSSTHEWQESDQTSSAIFSGSASEGKSNSPRHTSDSQVPLPVPSPLSHLPPSFPLLSPPLSISASHTGLEEVDSKYSQLEDEYYTH